MKLPSCWISACCILPAASGVSAAPISYGVIGDYFHRGAASGRLPTDSGAHENDSTYYDFTITIPAPPAGFGWIAVGGLVRLRRRRLTIGAAAAPRAATAGDEEGT